MKKVFMTFLATDDFLPGVRALNRSLKRFGNTNYPLIVIVSAAVSKRTVKKLEREHFNIKITQPIISPYFVENDYRNFNCTVSKLRIFEMDEYDKIVYIDSDMLVCENIESLFQKSHMSAVIAGGVLPSNSSWKDLNTGLLIIEPSTDLFNQMLDALKFLPSTDGSDQGFIHNFFPLWKYESHLHLEHKYNVPSWYLDEYCASLNFEFNFEKGILSTKNISIIHFWGLPKPWEITKRVIGRLSKKAQAELLWMTIYKETDILKQNFQNSDFMFLDKQKHR